MVRCKQPSRCIKVAPVLSKGQIRRMQRKKGLLRTPNTTDLEKQPKILKLQGWDISVLYQNRYCDQQEFGVVLCGCRNTKTRRLSEHVVELKGEKITSLPSMLKVKSACQSAVIGSNVYNVTDDQNYDSDPSIEVFSTNNWKYLTSIPNHKKDFTLCSFMQQLFFISGTAEIPEYCSRRYHVYDCLSFDPKSNQWKNKASMKRRRIKAASAVFQGKIVVTGGIDGYNAEDKKSVEEYDHHRNKWTYLPDMIKRRSSHSACSMGNKLYIIGGHNTKSCEVFDSFSGKFSFIKSAPFRDYRNKSVCLGYQINVYRCNERKVFVYNTDENNWVTKRLNFKKSKNVWLSCVRCPSTCKNDVSKPSFSKFLSNEASVPADNFSESCKSYSETFSFDHSESDSIQSCSETDSWSRDISSSELSSLSEISSGSNETEYSGNGLSESFSEPAAKRFKGNAI